MHKIIKFISVIMAITLFATTFVTSTSALSKNEIQNEINKLEQESKKLEAEISKYQGQINAQEKLKDAIERKMAVTQSQINACNNQINQINDQISKNKAEIEKNNEQIEADKLEFKKRLRAIYMSNTGSNVQILLGADNFADFLQLSQMTASVSAHDKKMIEDIVAEIKKLEKKQKENKKLLEEKGIEVKDFGSHDTNSIDYPDIALPLCESVVSGECECGILVCGTGIGMSMVANKHKGIRAACVSDVFSAKATRMHNAANVLCFGERVVGAGLAFELVDAFLSTEYEGGRHQRRVDMVNSFDK